MAKITIGRILDSSTDSVLADQGAAAADVDSWPVRDLNKLVPNEYDHIDLAYTGDNITTVVYRVGGGAGSIVATLTLSYTGDRLDSVTRT